MTSDIEAARKFYSGLLGWKYKVSRGRRPLDGGHDADPTGDELRGRGHGRDREESAVGWPNAGRFAVLVDPQGARFASIKLSQR